MVFKDSTLWKVIKNKYFIATVIFCLLFFFFDENNFFVSRSLRKDVGELNKTIDTLLVGIEQDSLQAGRLKDNMDSIERSGRERYFMKAKDEDVFIVSRPDN